MLEQVGTEELRVDQVEVKQRMRSLWAEGDWPAIAVLLDSAARALVEQCGVTAGDRVLEVAAGNGNVAVWAARHGARVVATDLSAVLVEQGRQRCAAEGLEVEWREADMEELPFADDSFDSVLCAFGITFAACPEIALSEMFRVTRPGGCIALANWTRDGWAARIGAVMESHLRPESDKAASGMDAKSGSLSTWLLEHAATVRMERGVVSERFASPESWCQHWHANSPQMAVARRVLSNEQYEHLCADLLTAATAAGNANANAKANGNGNGNGNAHANGNGNGWCAGSEYLVIVASKRPGGNGGRSPRAFETAASA